MRAFTYLLEHISDHDLYQQREDTSCEEDDEDEEDLVVKTGEQLRAIHIERQAQIATMPHLSCVRCDGETTWIGYCDIAPYNTRPLQHTFFMQCRECGLYRQVGFANGDDWRGETYQELMHYRIPFVRVAHDPFLRNDTLRVTSRDHHNPMGRINLNGHEFHTSERITLYDQETEEWRDGRIAYGDNWYFTSRDGGPDIQLKQGMKARICDN